MASPSKTPTPRPKQRKRNRELARSKPATNKVEKRVGGKNLSQAVSPPPQAQRREQLNILEPVDEIYIKEEFPLPRRPLTLENLEEHTLLTNIDDVPLKVTLSVVSDELSKHAYIEQQKLTLYGWILLPDYGAFPDALENFVNRVVKRANNHDTTGAKHLHDLQWKVKVTHEAKAILFMARWLLPREEDDSFDRIVGFASPTSGLKSPFVEAEWSIIQHHMVEGIHDEVHFPFMTAEFERAKGRSIHFADLQEACAGIAANNHMRDFLQKAGFAVTELDTVHFSITCDARVAALHLHWLDSSGFYCMKRIYVTLLAAPDHLGNINAGMVAMRGYIRNIVAWAKDVRLKRIKAAVAVVQGLVDAEEAKDQELQGKGRGKKTSSSNLLRTGGGASSASGRTASSGGRTSEHYQPTQQQQDGAAPRRSKRLKPAQN
ncbi:hypothetical protein SVAN01_04933 [Stagonosporopsis vannaccii]|nr:hypothetical protein SVAN01_04933 [Stagonosporopsis vannaccii]